MVLLIFFKGSVVLLSAKNNQMAYIKKTNINQSPLITIQIENHIPYKYKETNIGSPLYTWFCCIRFPLHYSKPLQETKISLFCFKRKIVKQKTKW